MGKSAKHKTQNVHHFVSFSERISSINVDVIHRIRRADDQTEETFFGEALAQWTDLDLTDHFTNFRREITGQVQTFEQLVHHKEEIIASVKKHLTIPKSLAINALLDLLVQLARDLQEDFVPHFQDFFTILVHILTSNSQNAEVLEQTFQTLAFLFRVLWRFLVKDFTTVFSYFSQLLGSSQKDYIKVFAAESCAYLLRKVKKQDELLNFLFGCLKKTPELADGIGLLLFEMVKGVKQHFHTTSTGLFPLILYKLGPWSPSGKKKKAGLPRNLIEQSVTVFMHECAEHASKENFTDMWEILLDCTSQVHVACLEKESQEEGGNKAGSAGLVQHLCRLLRLLSVWLTHNSGSIVTDPEHVASTLCVLLKSLCCPEKIGPDLTQAAADLLTSCHERLSVELLHKLNSLLFSAPLVFAHLKTFVTAVRDLPFFEKDALPGCMTRIHTELSESGKEQAEEILCFIVDLVLHKTSSPVTGEDLDLLQTYVLDRTLGRSAQSNLFTTYVDSLLVDTVNKNQSQIVSDLPCLWGAVVCIPHVSITGVKEKSLSLWKRLVQLLRSSQTDVALVDCLVVILNQLLKSILTIHLKDKSMALPVQWEEVFDIVRSRPSSPCTLQTLDLFLSWPASASLLTSDRLSETFTMLQANLISPSHNVRLLTCHILAMFPLNLPDYEDGITREGAFKQMYEAERIVPTVHTYREKLMHLRKLECDHVIKCLPSHNFHKAPLMFLSGNQFWNFKLLWNPLADIIASHAFSLDPKEFWEVMLGQLTLAAQESEKELRENSGTSDPSIQSSMSDLLTSYRTGLLKDSRAPDYTSYRLQLWKSMKKFPEKCVLRSDELCDIYLNFLQNEFSHADESNQAYQNILDNSSGRNISPGQVSEQHSKLQSQNELHGDHPDQPAPAEDIMEKENEEDEEDEEDEEEMDTAEPMDKDGVIRRRRAALKSLLAHLDLFAMFKKQRSKFNQPQVQETFYDLLKHRVASVQKAAFDCILTYKSPHILPYKENFLRLLDDKTFKSEIVLFRVDEESSQVKEGDREGLLPVLMRILYGKLHGSAGNETAGKSRSNLRRSVIFGFLSGCKPSELRYFLELLFQPCLHFITDNPVQMVEETMAKLELSKMIPLKRMKGVLNTVNTVYQKVGHRLEGFAHSLLHILLGLVSSLTAALNRRIQVLQGAVKLLKTLRHTVMTRIIKFFELYEDLDYTSHEIEAVFVSVVWPQAEKLMLEGVHHPTPLLKLFLLWSQSRRFLPLLVHGKTSESPAVNPLSCTFSLLNAPSINPTVAMTILNLVSNLLPERDEMEDGEPGRVLPALPEPFTLSPECDVPNCGEKLLLPYVPDLLTFLQGSLRKMSSGSGNKKQTSVMELKILARLSHVVSSPDDCHTLCDLLIPFFVKGSNLSQDIEENTLLSLTNMMQYIDKPAMFYRTIAQLFGTIQRRQSRTLLCRLLKVITEKDAQLATIADLVEKLNAWDPRRAEEPDYLRRLEAFGQVTTLLSGIEEPGVDALLPLIYNCCHFIEMVDDLSIRDNSTHCLTSIIKRLASSTSSEGIKTFNIVIEKTLVPQVKMGLRHKAEAVRQEFLAVWQSLVRHCPNHQMFTGLKDLCDADPEADFFENIRHIQIHKRSRALRRLFKHLKDHQFRPEIHMSYFVPLVYAFLLDQSYAKHANVQDAAIDLLGAICKQLPWLQYLGLLRFYLKLLPKKVEMQRQIVRIVVALLDAFHFDLSQSTYRVSLAPKDVEKKGDVDDGDGQPDKMEEEMEKNGDKDNQQEISKEVEDILPSEFEVPEAEEMETEEVVAENSKTNDGIVHCSASASTRIHKTIVISLLPQLHKIVTQRAKSDDEHKLVKSKYPEDEEILRVPIALAMVKLLQNLPKGTLENRLPGILLKICNFLRSRSRDVRTTARETLEKIALSLGSRFFPFIVREMRAILTRGYQLHVLSYTTYQLLKALSGVVSPGDLDPALTSIQEVFYAELFGQVAEEKEVEAIKAKYFEAKFIKGYDAYELLAKNVSSGRLHDLIKPIRGVLETTHSQRTANKAETVLRKVAGGLIANPSIPLEAMMIFINNLTTKLLAQMVQNPNSKPEDSSNKASQSRMPDSCLLLPQATPRGGIKPKASKQTNIHVLVEFGLQLLNMVLKKSSLLPTEHVHLQMLDPLVPAIRDCLNHTHVKTSANAMRCLSWLLKFPLPSLKENIVPIAQGMFLVLQSYAGAATAKGGNQELISMCFKAVTVLVRDVAYYQLSLDQLQVLLTYCEEDLYNYNRQSTAFNLIRAILSRKLDTSQLHQVMEKLFEMSITAHATNIRLQCRQVILLYLMNYPLGKTLRKHLYFYTDHLEYEMEEGRESAIEMMISFFSTFPQKILNNHCPKFFVALAMSSFNDSSARCRKLVSVALKTLIGKVDLKRRKALFADVLKWMKSDVCPVRAMAFQVCGMFVEVEGGKFEFYLEDVLPLLQQQMNPEQYSTVNEDGEEDAVTVEQRDMCLLAVLSTTLKVVRELSIIRQARFTSQLNLIWSHVLSHLSYPHTQVRLASCQLLGHMFTAWEPADLGQQYKEGKMEGDTENEGREFLLRDTPGQVRKLANALCQQLKGTSLDDVLATQVIKNLLYLARVAEALGRPEDLVWLAKKVMKEANMEVINNVKVTLKRNHAFKWVAAVGVTLQAESVQRVLPVVLPVLQREMTDQAQDQDLKNLALEVVDLLKKQVGVEAFTAAFANSQKWRLEKREDRKRQLTAQAVTNPDIAAKKKIRHNLKKKEARKREIEEKKQPGKRIKKNKLSILNVTVEDD